jgi:cytochrome P450
VAVLSDASLTVPEEIAAAVILPESYERFEEVTLPAAAWLRDNMPVGRAELPGYDPLWILSRHAEISEVLKDAKRFHNADFNPILETRSSDDFTRSINDGSTRIFDSMSYMDPPEHPQYRKVLAKKFEPATVRAEYEARFRRLAVELVDEFVEIDGECDFIADFATHYPVRVTMSILGVPPEDHLRMLTLTKEFFGGADPDTQREEFKGFDDAPARQWAAATAEFQAFFQELREQRAIDPQDDLTTFANALLTTEGSPWPDRIKNSFLATIAPAGIDTTVSAIASGMLGMIRYPDQWRLVKESPDLIPGLVDESIRWATPTKTFMRNATVETTVGGVPLQAMDRIVNLLFSGNRDPEVFADPDRFDVTRNATRHLSFGFGPHRCLGQHIATTEMRILFEELLPRLDSVELTAAPQRERSSLVSGLKTLPIRFHKA